MSIRHLLAGLCGIAAAVLSPALLAADAIDLDTPEGYVAANRKLQCSTVDGKHTVYFWQGRAYSRVPGERDRNLFQVLGMNVRQCGTISDPTRGEGYRMVSREIMLYLDPKTGEILRQWENPFTGETVDVIHVANDPVNGRPSFGVGKDGKPQKLRADIVDNTVFMAFEVPLFYTNPLGGEFQEQVGGTYHSAEIFDFILPLDQLVDPKLDTVPDASVAWVRMAPWLPWMNMGSRAGIMYFNAVGKKLASWDELPEKIKQEIKTNYPKYTAPPPLDDKRRNETSWTYFKKILTERKKAAASE